MSPLKRQPVEYVMLLLLRYNENARLRALDELLHVSTEDLWKELIF